jgi:hypothetical protein
MHFIVLFCCLAFYSTNSFSAESKTRKPAEETAVIETTANPSPFNWKAFNLGGYMALVGGTGFSGELLWKPTYSLVPNLNLKGNLGGTLLPSAFSTTFIVIDAEVLASYRLFSWLEIDGGGGVQYWLGNGGFVPVVKGSLQWVFENKKLWVIDRIYASYYRLLGSILNGNMFSLGVGIAF